MHSCDNKRTAIALLALLVASVGDAKFTGCEGQDFVSKQCAEDGEMIAPLLMEDISFSKDEDRLQKREAVLNSISPAEYQKDSAGVAPKSLIKNTHEATETAVLKRSSKEVAANQRVHAVSKQQKQQVNSEAASTVSQKQSVKPSPQSFTHKLHNTVAKINRASAKPVDNEHSDRDRNRVPRSLPIKDVNKVSPITNSLSNQPTEKGNLVAKSVQESSAKQRSQETTGSKVPETKTDTPSIKSDSPKTEKVQPALVPGHSTDKSKHRDKGKINSSSHKDPIRSGTHNRIRRSATEQTKPLITSGTVPTLAETSKVVSTIATTTSGKVAEEGATDKTKTLATSETVPASPTLAETSKVLSTTATTISGKVAEEGFMVLPEKFDKIPADVVLPEHTELEKPAFEVKYDSVQDRNEDFSKATNTKNVQRPPSEPQKLVASENLKLEETQVRDIPNSSTTETSMSPKAESLKSDEASTSSTEILPSPVAIQSDNPLTTGDSVLPKAEYLKSELPHDMPASSPDTLLSAVDIQSDNPSTTEDSIPSKAESLRSELPHDIPASSPDTLPSPVAIRLDNRDRDTEFDVYDDRLRTSQRPSVPKLAFPDVPQGESFHIQDLGLSEGLFVFSYLSSFLSWIQPYDFPVELLRDALWKKVSVVDLITESLQVEVGFIVCLTVGVLLALGVPCILLVHACCRMFDSKSSSDGWNEQEQAHNCAGNCRRVTLVFIMQLVLVLLVAGIVSMFVTNEQMSHAVEQTPTAVHTALNDVTTFLRNSHQQLRFVVTKTLDQAVDAIVTDLDNIEELLGRPIQDQIATETGVDIALDALVDVSAEARAISAKVEALLSNAASTRDLIVDSRERLADLRLQVDLFRRQCPSRFRPLCDTVDTTGLDVVLRIESLMTEQRLTRVRDLRDGNLTLVAQQARGEFQYVPMRVEKDTKDSRNAIKRQLARQKEALYDSAWSLDVVTRDLSYRVEEARNTAMQIVRGIGDVEQWRWLTGLGAASAVLFLWLLLLAGVTCGCCGAEGRAGSTLLASVVLMSIFSVGLWALALSALLVGGHGQVFVCRPLYDEPGYSALTRLVDRPGVLFQRSSGSFLSNMLYGNGTLDVPLRDVLEECQADGPAYRAFRLHQVFDVDSASDHRRWENVHTELRRLRVDLSDMQLLSPELQAQLQEMLLATTVNLTNYRAQISRQVTGRDLASFADQLTNVANQITDLTTLSRLETLSSKTRRLLLSHIQPLEQRKEDLVYQLTALEVQMAPLQRQVNQSLSHLRTIQFFIDNQAANISAQKSQEYVGRLVGYMDQFQDHVLNTTNNFVAPCRPIWNLYHAMRVLFCRHVMDPLNGFWFATVWCLLLFLVATPPCLKLVDHYRHLKNQHQHNSSLLNPHTERQLMHVKEKVSINRSPSETLMISDQAGHWSTPGSGEADGW